MFGEPDNAVTELIKDARWLDSPACLEKEEVLTVSGPRRRRRAAPYPRTSESRYSSEELSSSGRSLSYHRKFANRRRRDKNDTSMAEASSASLVETSDRNARRSSTSSKRKTKSFKLGYTLPDIQAWQMGLDGGKNVSSTAT